MTTHSETSELNLSAPVPLEGETWVRTIGMSTTRVVMTADSPHANVPDDIVTVRLAEQRRLLLDAGYHQWFGPVDQSPVNCCAETEKSEMGMASRPSPPPGSVDQIVSYLRAELEDLLATDPDHLGLVTSSIQSAEQGLVRCEEEVADASQRVADKHQRVRDIQLAIERLS